MKLKRLLRSSSVAGAFAALCVMFTFVGAIVALAAGFIGLVIVSRQDPSKDSGFAEYPWWIWCTISFITATLVFSPMADLPAVWIAICLLSPLFGTASYVVERALNYRIHGT